MRRIHLWVILAITLTMVVPISSNVFAEGAKRECGNMHWTDKGHDDNSPSSSAFKKAAYTKSLCELAKGIDHEVYSNHDSVNWNKFQHSIAYTGATEEQQDCMKEAHQDGNGMKELGGYEILYCAIDKD